MYLVYFSVLSQQMYFSSLLLSRRDSWCSSQQSVAFSTTVYFAYSRWGLIMPLTTGIIIPSVCPLVWEVTNCRKLTVKMKEGWDGGAWRRGFPLLLCSLYLLPAELRGNHFSIPIHRTSSLMYSPFLLCVYVCPSPTVTFPPTQLPLFILLSVPISVLCVSLSSPAQLWGRFSFIAVAMRDPLETYCSHTHTHNKHNKHTDYSAAVVKLSLIFTHHNITINQRSVARPAAAAVSIGVRWKRTRCRGPFKAPLDRPILLLMGCQNLQPHTHTHIQKSRLTGHQNLPELWLLWLHRFPDLHWVGLNACFPPASGRRIFATWDLPEAAGWAAGGGRSCSYGRQGYEHACTSSADGPFILGDRFPAPPSLCRVGTERPRPPGLKFKLLVKRIGMGRENTHSDTHAGRQGPFLPVFT